ncbi:hypothetical protein [Ktedonospora formicarum]|uniref:Response regulatory domain-containing protein n=1 Tax=Ktedonospora formicarum TaxID=2778364 RepID=A0A8J3MV54_9CHLR|nr:hypothetical protein [Ktedonospora formicarum]GHO48940.1 hypothetical protein KSX_71030 [Ktedonospora formicarum]
MASRIIPARITVTLSQILFEDLKEVEHLQPDLILLDLPIGKRQTEWDFLQKLKLHRPTMHIPLILCTAALNEVQEQETVLMQKGILVFTSLLILMNCLPSSHNV